MTVRRWPILIALATGPLPGCLIVGSGSSTPEPQAKAVAPPPTPAPVPPGTQFSTLPSRPGEKVPTNVAARKTAPTPTVTGRPPTTPALPETPQPPEGLTAISAEPTPFPLLPPSAAAEPPLLAAVRAYVENRPDKAIEHLKSLDKTSQDFVLAVLPLLVRGAQLKVNGTDPAEVAVLVDQMHAAAARLEPRAALRIDKVVFCQWVSGFGRYDPWPDNTPYRPNDVAEVYVEVRHLTSEPAPGPKGDVFTTRAAVSLEIRDAKGKIIDQPDPADYRLRVPVRREEHNDTARTPPRDFWRRYRLVVPPAAGVYTVTVEVKDATGRTAKSKPAQFTVAGP